jgi:hypothetical protein
MFHLYLKKVGAAALAKKEPRRGATGLLYAGRQVKIGQRSPAWYAMRIEKLIPLLYA